MRNMFTLSSLGAAFVMLGTAAHAAGEPVIGLITKTDTNPFFVKMKEGAQAEAKKLGAKLMTASGKKDGDTAAQITAIENMVTAGAKTLLITSSGDANPSAARAKRAISSPATHSITASHSASSLVQATQWRQCGWRW